MIYELLWPGRASWTWESMLGYSDWDNLEQDSQRSPRDTYNPLYSNGGCVSIYGGYVYK